MTAKTVSEFIDGLLVNVSSPESVLMQVRIQYHWSDIDKAVSDKYSTGDRYTGPEIALSFYPMAELSLMGFLLQHHYLVGQLARYSIVLMLIHSMIKAKV